MRSAMLAASQLPGGGPVHDADDAPAYNKSNTLIKNQIKHFIFVTGTRESFLKLNYIHSANI